MGTRETAIIIVVVILVVIILMVIATSGSSSGGRKHHHGDSDYDHYHKIPHYHTPSCPDCPNCPTSECPGCDIIKYEDFRIQEYGLAPPGELSVTPIPVNYSLSPFFEGLLPPEIVTELKEEYLLGAAYQEDGMLVLDSEPLNQAFVPVAPPVPFDLSNSPGAVVSMNDNFGIRKGDVLRWDVEASFDFVYDHDSVESYYGASNLIGGDPDLDPRVICPAIIIFATEISKNGLGDVIASATGTACFFFTKKSVWAYYDTLDLPIGPPFATSFFSHGKKVKEFDTSKKHVYGLEHDSRTNTHRWYIDGVLVRTVNNLGFYDTFQPGDTFVWRGGTEQPINATNFQCMLQGGARGKVVEGVVQNDFSVGPALESGGFAGLVPDTAIIPVPTPQPIFAKGRFYETKLRRFRP